MRQALVLGALQGPAELLPVSSSGHLTLVPALLGWDYADLPGPARKTVEVALHAGSAPALMLAVRRIGLGDPLGLALTLGPAAALGLALEEPIQRRLGTVGSVAVAQVVAGAALAGADALASRRGREREAADLLDHLCVGLAQAAALVPGVSRAGAALTAGRLRGLSRPAALRLSLRAALPVTLAAAALKGTRAAAGELAGELRAPVAVGAAAALVSGLASLPLVRLAEGRPALHAAACYRVALGALALLRSRRR